MKKKQNYLLEAVKRIFEKVNKGRVLDLGCGDGDYSAMLKELGFEIVACDLDQERFKYSRSIDFKKADITKDLDFEDRSFDYVLALEVIEHLKNPYSFIKELNRIIKPGGFLFLSTPNILNLKSRLRFLIEGSYEFFREPPLDQVANPKEKIFNLHLFPYRVHELEYLLFSGGFAVTEILASTYENFFLSFLLPIIKLQLFVKEMRSKKKGTLDYSRINKILFSKQLLFGRHLIIKASKFLNEKNTNY